MLSPLIHPTALIDEGCQLGDATQVLAYSHMMSHCVVGQHCYIGHASVIHSAVLLGNAVVLAGHVVLETGTIVEDGVKIGHGSIVVQAQQLRAHTVLGDIEPISMVGFIRPTVIKTGSCIGPHCRIAVGSHIGQYSFIEAGSTVCGNVPAYGIVSGPYAETPEAITGWRCRCGQALQFDCKRQAHCWTCAIAYEQAPDKLSITPIT